MGSGGPVPNKPLTTLTKLGDPTTSPCCQPPSFFSFSIERLSSFSVPSCKPLLRTPCLLRTLLRTLIKTSCSIRPSKQANQLGKHHDGSKAGTGKVSQRACATKILPNFRVNVPSNCSDNSLVPFVRFLALGFLFGS